MSLSRFYVVGKGLDEFTAGTPLKLWRLIYCLWSFPRTGVEDAILLNWSFLWMTSPSRLRLSRHLPCRVYTLFTISYAYDFLRHRILSSQTLSFLQDRSHPSENLPHLCNISISAVVYFWSNFNNNSCSSIVLPLLLHWLALSPTIFLIEPS